MAAAGRTRTTSFFYQNRRTILFRTNSSPKCTCLDTCPCTCLYTCANTHRRDCPHVRVHVCTHVHTHFYPTWPKHHARRMSRCFLFSSCLLPPWHAHMLAPGSQGGLRHVYMHVYAHVHTHVYTHIYAHVYAHVYTHRWIDEARVLVKPFTDQQAQNSGSCSGPKPTRVPTRAPTKAPVRPQCDKRDGYCTYAVDCTCPANMVKVSLKTGSGQTCYGCRYPTRSPTLRPTRHPTRSPTLAPTRRPTRAPTPVPVTRAPTRPPECTHEADKCTWSALCTCPASKPRQTLTSDGGWQQSTKWTDLTRFNGGGSTTLAQCQAKAEAAVRQILRVQTRLNACMHACMRARRASGSLHGRVRSTVGTHACLPAHVHMQKTLTRGCAGTAKLRRRCW